MDNKLFIGFDIGGTKCSVVGSDGSIDIHDRVVFENRITEGPGKIISRLIEEAQKIISSHPEKKPISAGISCGGPLDNKNGIILSPPNLPGWDRIEIVEILSTALNIPVYLENDANACALAEWRFGAGKGCKNMVFLTFGTGLGAGLILNGRLYTGTNCLAGEIGHIRLADSGPEAYGKVGSFEAFCSGSGIARWAKMRAETNQDRGENGSSRGSASVMESITTKKLAERASKGDALALDLFHESARYLGKGLSILIDVLNPELIVIGSVYARNTHLFESEMMRVLEEEALSASLGVCSVVPAALGELVGDYACLSVAVDGSIYSNWETK